MDKVVYGNMPPYGPVVTDHAKAGDYAFAVPPESAKTKYSHYYKPCPYDHIDVYRVIELFGVTDPCVQHAIKKLLTGGKRGTKGVVTDWKEAIATLERAIEMKVESGDT